MKSSAVDTQRTSLNWLQCLRGVSFLLVLFYHVGNVVDLHFGDSRIVQWFAFGRSGVDIFFVISGFVMFYLHRRDFGHPEQTKVFLKKRFVRIYPIYWVLTTMVLIAALVLPAAIKAYKLHPLAIAESYLLLPLQFSGLPIIPPGWSLFHEVKFYLLFAMLILLRPPWYRLWLAGWAVLSLAVTGWIVCSELPFGDSWQYFWCGPYNLEFLAGCLAGWFVLHRRPLPAWAGTSVLALGAVILSLAAYQDVASGLTLIAGIFGYGMAGLGLVIGAVMLDLHPASAQSAPRLLQRLGDASYSAYLAHYPVLFILAKVLKSLLGPAAVNAYAILLALLLLVACLVVCLMVHRMIEAPLLRKCREWSGLK